jgi:hypothetical protein
MANEICGKISSFAFFQASANFRSLFLYGSFQILPKSFPREFLFSKFTFSEKQLSAKFEQIIFHFAMFDSKICRDHPSLIKHWRVCWMKKQRQNFESSWASCQDHRLGIRHSVEETEQLFPNITSLWYLLYCRSRVINMLVKRRCISLVSVKWLTLSGQFPPASVGWNPQEESFYISQLGLASSPEVWSGLLSCRPDKKLDGTFPIWLYSSQVLRC